MARELSLKRVQAPSGQVHGHRPLGRIQGGQLVLQLACMGWLDACLRSRLEELLQAGMSERPNHPYTV